MIKKLLSIFLCMCLVFTFAACGKQKENPDNSQTPSTETNAPAEEKDFVLNPLTGIYNLPKSKANTRPVAIMIDNDSVAQRYTQSGISDADIVYETETEAGITRLMAVFADISKAKQLGDVRSARYVFVDLAMGHNAIYVHSGSDATYCRPHLQDLDNFEITYGYFGERIHYGEARNWQELFTTGETLANAFVQKNWQTTAEKINAWQSFADEKEELTLKDSANKITVKFSSVSTSYFDYDEKTGKYLKSSRYVENKDRNNKNAYAFKNVFILKTDMSAYPDKKHCKVELEGGNGYYCVNGKSIPIRWEKGKDSDPIVLTNTDGTPLKVNSGSSWVCIARETAELYFE